MDINLVCYNKECGHQIGDPSKKELDELRKNNWRCPECSWKMINLGEAIYCPFCNEKVTTIAKKINYTFKELAKRPQDDIKTGLEEEYEFTCRICGHIQMRRKIDFMDLK